MQSLTARATRAKLQFHFFPKTSEELFFAFQIHALRSSITIRFVVITQAKKEASYPLRKVKRDERHAACRGTRGGWPRLDWSDYLHPQGAAKHAEPQTRPQESPPCCLIRVRLT